MPTYKDAIASLKRSRVSAMLSPSGSKMEDALNYLICCIEEIESGGDVNKEYKLGYTALMLAAELGDFTAVAVLLENGADVNSGTVNSLGFDGLTALMLGVLADHKGIEDLLISNGSDVNARDRNGHTVLMIAAWKGSDPSLLIARGADVNARGTRGTTALIEAAAWCNFGGTHCLKALIANGANVNAKDDYGVTALMCAVDKGNRIVVELLLDNGADVNARDNDGETVLMYAKRPARDWVIVEMLKQRGAK